MQTAQLTQIVRQKDPELLKAAEHLSKGEVAPGIAMLQQQGRVTEVKLSPQQRGRKRWRDDPALMKFLDGL